MADLKACTGQYSIQKEINRLAMQDKTNWAQKIQVSNGWRAEVYKRLRAQPGVLWCDYKAGECNCD